MSGAKINFSQEYEKLEKIVADFESHEIDLEKDLPKFEEGLKLATRLKKRLGEIENMVVKIEIGRAHV